jgi:cysteine desulfurase / selenocysteine lyase
MSTGDPSEASDAASLATAIERLANEYFALTPAVPSSPGVASPQPIPSPGADAPVAPARGGPNAAYVGAGGASPAVLLPPVPGPVARPPLASSPPPKESDLRAIPTLFSEAFGLPSVVALASGAPTPDAIGGPWAQERSGQPYFLALAGPPSPSLAPSLTHAPVAPSPPAAAAPTAPAAVAPSLPTAASYDFRPELVPVATSTPATAPQRGMFDPNVVKADFPILSERVHGGRRLVWLDNAATTQKPRSVIDRVSFYYEHENSNVHRAAHALAARATDAYEGARETVRRFLNAPSTREIVFVRGATEGINLVAQSWGRRNVAKGDEIVITWLEHHANIVPWQQLCSEKGARLRVAPVDDRGQVILEEYEKLLGPRTRIVSFTQVSNALGTITPAEEMVAMARRHGARVHVDGAQAVSHMPVDVQALGCDFYTFSGHKIFAPMGIGVVFGKAELLETMPPWQGGGNMIQDVTFERAVYQEPPWRFEAGTGSIGDAVGLGAALDYVSALGLENIRRYEHELHLYAEEQLRRVPGLAIIGTAAEKAGVISFVLDGVRTEDVGGALDQEGIAVRSGHHCAQPILRRFGLESSVRASLAPYNTRDDVDALVAALRRLQAGRPEVSTASFRPLRVARRPLYWTL